MAIIEGPEFTFTPGATKSANTYGDWAQLMVKISTQPVRRPIITFTANFTLPTGTFDLKGGTIRSPNSVNNIVVLTIPDGAVIDNLYSIDRGLTVECNGTTTDTFTFSATPGGTTKSFKVGEGASLKNLGSVALISVGLNESLQIEFTQNASGSTAGYSYVEGTDDSATIVAIDGGPATNFDESWITGIGTLTYLVGAYFSPPLIGGWAGTLATNYNALSSSVSYSAPFPIYWPAPTPDNVQDALDSLAERVQGVEVLAGLSIPGTYNPNEFLGPFYNAATDPSILAAGSGSGFFRATQKGTYSIFCWTNSNPPVSLTVMDLYYAAGGNPAALAYSGISLTMGAGDYISTNSTDSIAVDVGDLICFYNPNLIVGYTASNLTITAHFTKKLS